MAAPKTRNGNTWTEGTFNSFIKSMLRRGSTRWGPKYECKKNARVPLKFANLKNRYVFHSKCASCEKIYPETECSVDHINPIIDPTMGFLSWDKIIENLFCELDGLQVLCKKCHDEKTQKEKLIAKSRRSIQD